MSEATLETVRAAIGGVMRAVPRIGCVHAYERYSATERGLATLHMWQPPEPDAKPELRTWFIRRVATRQRAESTFADIVEIDWQIRAYLALQDVIASEVTFDNLVEQVRHRFLADVSLGGLLDAPRLAQAPLGPQLAEASPYMFSGVLCHGARLDWTTAYRAPRGIDPAADPDVGEFRIFHANWDIPPHGNVKPPLPADATADATDHVLIPGAAP